jgi:hypothetical protein
MKIEYKVIAQFFASNNTDLSQFEADVSKALSEGFLFDGPLQVISLNEFNTGHLAIQPVVRHERQKGL